ncbi:hypothetical protein INT48_004414 [Thamnidium elegans]|uniref:Uncharacterized protein n=1 Tax=Thamnidium elegans TaxID=101142 RepID=A0A8H7ST63_9FUNG|nr:hypothetical protein INT48_004414 [Thamnidium elegans]
MKERFDTIKRMAGIPVYEELEFDAPIQTKYPNIRREKHGTEEHKVAKEDLMEEEKDTEIYDPVYEEEETEIYNQEEEAPSYQKSAPMTFYPRAGKYDYFDTVDEEQDIQYEEEDIQDENQGIENENQEEGSSRKRYSPVLSGIDELSSYQENAFETFDYNRARVERRPSWPLVKSGSQILYRLVDDLGSVIVEENEVMRILRHHYEELMNNPGSPISEVLVTSLYHNNPSIRDFAYALIFRIPPSTTPGTPFTPPVRYRSNSVDDQIDFDGYGYPPEPLFYYVRSDNDVDYSTSSLSNQNTASELDQDVPFVFHPEFVPSPLSENNDDNADQDESNVVVNTESELDQDVPFVFNPDFVPSPVSEANDGNADQDESNTTINTESELDQDVPFVTNTDFEPSPVSEVNDRPGIMSIVSGEYIPDNEAESNAGRIPSGTEPTITNSASHYSTDSTVSLLRVPNNTVSENAIPSDLDSFLDTPPYTQFEIDCINNNVYHWMRHNVYTGSEATDIPRVLDTNEEEEHRWEYLGFDEYDRDGFAHLFFKLPRATFPDLQELRDKMDMIKQTFRKLTSDTYVRFFNHQVLLDDMLPESVDILEEVQMAYREMVYQYINYQRSLEEYELGYTLLGTIEFIDCYKHHIRTLLYKLEEESVKEVSALNQPVFESVYKTMCEGTQMVANLKRAWKTYVESSSAFKNVQKTYQGSIDKIEQEFVIIVGDFYIIYETYLIMRSG